MSEIEKVSEIGVAGIQSVDFEQLFEQHVKPFEEHYEAAKAAVNSYTFDPKKLATTIPSMHPTLQQSLYRLVKECIKVMANESRRYDNRNRASHEEAVRILEYLNEHGKNIPLR